jgi:serine/threonine protein kinase
MEYADGGELFNHIVDKKRLDETEASFFYVQIINGLENIHKNNIVHRDLKPENLLISENKVLKIIDFGLSNTSKPNQLLQTPCGSPCYAAPEMILGKRYSGLNVDIWSTGIILYAMVCGYLPFEDKNNNKLYKKILECKLEFPSYLSENCKDFICRILNTNPQKRIKLEEIKKHTFFKVGEMLVNRIHTSKTNPAFKQLVIDKMVNIGFNNNEIESNLENPERHNNVTTTYDLLMNRVTNDDLESPVKTTSGNININISCVSGVGNININIGDNKKDDAQVAKASISSSNRKKPLTMEELIEDEEEEPISSKRSPRLIEKSVVESIASSNKPQASIDNTYFNVSSVGFVETKTIEARKKVNSSVSYDANLEYLKKSLDLNIIKKQKLDVDGREFTFIYKNYQNKIQGKNNKLSYNLNKIKEEINAESNKIATKPGERNSLGLTIHKKSEPVMTNSAITMHTVVNTTANLKEMDIIPEDGEVNNEVKGGIMLHAKQSKIQNILNDFHKRKKNLSVLEKADRYEGLNNSIKVRESGNIDIKRILSPVIDDKNKVSVFKSHQNQSPLKSRSTVKTKISNTIIDNSINTLSHKINSSITKVRNPSKGSYVGTKYIMPKSSKNIQQVVLTEAKVSNFVSPDPLNLRPSTSKLKNTLRNSLNQLNSLTNTVLYPGGKINTSMNLNRRVSLRDSQNNIFKKEFACCSISNVDNSEIKGVLGKFCAENNLYMKEVRCDLTL